MEKLEKGEVVKLSNNKDYICCNVANMDGKDYLYLVSCIKPVEVKFAYQQIIGEQIVIHIVEDQETMQKLIELFKN